ncbi:hypothetical protein F4679DRAFT_524191 [Xylaria curta]|nr:hypothetical protein F4679DRAFT_524191 [Xylaria curta]
MIRLLFFLLHTARIVVSTHDRILAPVEQAHDEYLSLPSSYYNFSHSPPSRLLLDTSSARTNHISKWIFKRLSSI